MRAKCMKGMELAAAVTFSLIACGGQRASALVQRPNAAKGSVRAPIHAVSGAELISDYVTCGDTSSANIVKWLALVPAGQAR